MPFNLSSFQPATPMRPDPLLLLAKLNGTPLLLRPGCESLPDLLLARALAPFAPRSGTAPRSDSSDDEEEEWYVTAAREYEAVQLIGSLAIIPCKGQLIPGLDQITAWYYQLCRPEAIQAACAQVAARADVTAVLFDCDSPGGFSTGIAETAAAITELGTSKTTLAFTGGDMCSAAYWLMSQTEKIFATPSATVGCIGTYTSICDYSKMYEDAGIKKHLLAAGSLKGQGTPGVPIKPEFLAFLQGIVDRVNATFLAAVKTGRGPLDAADLQGQWFDGQQAVEKNLADAVVRNRQELINALVPQLLPAA
jgi:ClpP class serine protease